MRKKKSCDALEWVVSELLSKLTQTMSPLAACLLWSDYTCCAVAAGHDRNYKLQDKREVSNDSKL